MLTEKPGKIAEGLYLMGWGMCLVYLVKGKDAMIIGGGMTWIVPQLEEQFAQMQMDPTDIKYLVIPHAHFDHCGAVPYLKRKFPWIKVLATESAKKILSKQKVVDYIELVNAVMAEHYGVKDLYEKLDLKIDSITIDQTVDDSSVVDLGEGLDIRFIETPGHSPCAVAVYVPKLKAIFPSDAAPTPQDSINNLTRPSPQFDYTLYKKSLSKLLTYDIGICGFDHYAAVTGADAWQVLDNGLKLCQEYEKRIVGLYQAMGDMEKVARVVSGETAGHFDFGSDAGLMMPVARAEVRNILKDAGVAAG